ncbi:MAG: hypothetical protein RIR97_843 [Pseudomonadota bacterium]
MRKLLISVMASTVALIAFTETRAADVVDQVPVAPSADYSTPASGTWAGPYVGGAATYNWGKFQSGKENGFGGQLYGGYNMQDGQIVYGAEADVGYSGNHSSDGTVKTTQGINGSVRGRVGYDLSPALVYGTAGVAATRLKASDATSGESKTAIGWTAGAGVEALVTDSITARVEYRYTDYANSNFKLTSGTVSRGYDEHSVKVGLGVKF